MKKVSGTIVGVIVAIVIVVLVEMISHKIYPLPKGLDPTNPLDVTLYMKTVPAGALLLVILGHLLATLAGNFVGLSIAKLKRPMYVISGLFLAMVLMNLYMVPHPTWFAIADVSGVVLAFLIPYKLTKYS